MTNPAPGMGAQKPGALVLAPLFPSINQPWMDTYLRQLVSQSFRVTVVTLNSQAATGEVATTSSPIDVVFMPADRVGQALGVLRSLFASPRLVARVWRVVRGADGGGGAVKRFLRALHALGVVRRAGSVGAIHSHSERMSCWFLDAAEALSIPMVVTFHGLPPNGLPSISPSRRRQISERVARVLVNTRSASSHAQALGYSEEKLEVIPQGLPVERFCGPTRRTRRASRPVEILCVGRLNREKGQGYLLLAIARLLRNGRSVRVHVVGVGPDRDRLDELCRKHGLAESVTFHGPMRNEALIEKYYEADLLILPSTHRRFRQGWVETQGVVLQEAQATGCIPIATRVGGIPECINHGVDGWLIRDRSHRAIAEAIEYFIDHPEQWPAYQEAGRQNVEENFSADVVGRRMQEILVTAAAQGASRP